MQLPQNAEDHFEADALLQDEWLPVKEGDEPEPFDEVLVQKSIKTIQKAMAAESIIGNFYDWFLSTMHPACGCQPCRAGQCNKVSSQ